ncbi:MAG TPA: ABC transporter ATP-binding protein [Candidatus Sulfotelmatobacter sp.]|nr:ABC transporter ATP-binding protein [Candidatus Sulfotelmatobacter sp.]
MNHNKAQVIMKYKLNTENTTTFEAIRKFVPILKGEQKDMVLALFALLINTTVSLIAPIIVGITIDTAIMHKEYSGIISASFLLFALFLIGFVASYFQTILMGSVGQRLLFTLRNTVFMKLQELPVAFFSQNKTGDLISRINNDTDKLNQFFSQALMQFVGSIFMMVGAAVFILVLDFRLGLAALAPAVLVIIFTQLISPWIKKKNAINLQAVGGMSAEIQESLDNFKVVIAFNRRDYFKKRFHMVNQANYKSAITVGIANTIFTPVYGLAANIAQIIVLLYGIYLISQHQFTIGFLISYFVYLTRFYDPIRQIASMWASFQVALAGWDRISAVLTLLSDLAVLPKTEEVEQMGVLTFRDVSFGYDGNTVLKKVSFTLERGKTYAFVGPTGGGKTTTASLMARLYDPEYGEVLFHGRNIKSYQIDERARKIGFILQEPFLFTGTVRDNILYGNEQYMQYSDEKLAVVIKEHGLSEMLKRFDQGLETSVTSHGETISLGQRQLIAFVRAILRKPELLILDEATANIDTVTEKLLGEILDKLPKDTTKVIIAHRLNTIENADEIFFVNAGAIIRAGSFKHAMNLLLERKRAS